jgi:predicted metal-dependent hydrolase
MRQLVLFPEFLKTWLPKRQAKTTVLPKAVKAAGPQIVEVSLGTRLVPVQVHRHARARSFTLSLTRDHKAVRLSLPKRAALRDGLQFVQEKRDLLLGWLAEEKPRIRIAAGETIPFRGRAHLILWDKNFPRPVACDEGVIRVGGPAELAGKRVQRWLKAQALQDLTRTTRAVAQQHGIGLSKISVNNAQARWGSCSSDGSVNYAWRLIFAPDEARHYVVCHELAHRTHMNHSAAFWREVTRLGGDLIQKSWFASPAARMMIEVA